MKIEKNNIDSIIFYIGIFPISLVLGSVFQILFQEFLERSNSSNFKVGLLATSGISKSGEISTLIFVGTVLMFFSFLKSKITKLPKFFQKVDYLIYLISLIAIPFYSQVILNSNQKILPIYNHSIFFIVSVQTSIVLAWILLHKNKGFLFSRIISFQEFIRLLFPAALMPLIASGLTLLLNYLLVPRLIDIKYSIICYLSIELIGVVYVYAIYLPKFAFNKMREAWLLSISSILILINILPSLYSWPINSQESNPDQFRVDFLPGMSKYAWLLFLICYSALIFSEFIFRNFSLKNGSNLKFSYSNIPSSAIAAILTPLHFSSTDNRIPTDDFHFGEVYSPAGLWMDFNQLPYIDFYPVRGILLNIAPGFLNRLLNDGSMSMLMTVMPVIAVITMFFVHLMLRKALGFPLATAAILILGRANSVTEGELIAVSIMFFMLWQTFSNNRFLALSYITLLPIAILAYPMIGLTCGLILVLLNLASIVWAAIIGELKIVKSKLILAGVISVLWILLNQTNFSYSKMVTGAINYVLTNAKSNIELNGIPLSLTFTSQPFRVTHILSFLFLSGFFISFYLIRLKFKEIFTSRDRASALNLILIASVPFLFCAILLGRFTGRMDVTSSYFNRAYVGSLLVLTLVIPGTLKLISYKKKVIAAFLVLSFAISGEIFTPETVMSKSLKPISSSSEMVKISAILPKLGHGSVDPEYVKTLEFIQTASSNIKDKTQILNLTNHNSYFEIFGWKSLTKYLAPYNIGSNQSEIEEVEKLVIAQPKYILIKPYSPMDAISLSLRNPILTSWIVQNYRPLICGPTVWAILKETSTYSGDLECGIQAIDANSDPQLLWDYNVGSPGELGIIPATWGKSISINDVGPLTKFEFIEFGTTQKLILKISGLDSHSRNLLFLNSTCGKSMDYQYNASFDSKLKAELRLFNASDNTYSKPITLNWGTGNFIIPLDSFPFWLMNKESISSIELDLPTSECPAGWKISSTFLER